MGGHTHLSLDGETVTILMLEYQNYFISGIILRISSVCKKSNPAL